MIRLALLASLTVRAIAHGDHSFGLGDDTDAGLSYAERHMHTEHHIDAFDLESFFKLHDLDMNGFWDELEVQAVYGLHHHSAVAQDGRAMQIVQEVMDKLDADGDGRITLAEFMAGGTEGLPSFAGYKDLGHHYDEESEYFLHHEELYHSTPETQTDESYTHPEDIQHFQHHAEIEEEEDARERIFEGLASTADLAMDHVVADPLEHHAHAPGEGPTDEDGVPLSESDPQDGQEQLQGGDEVEPPVRVVTPKRVDPGAAPLRIMKSGTAEEMGSLKEAAKEEIYGGGRPKSPEERLRAGVPYKYKMRKGLRSDEF